MRHALLSARQFANERPGPRTGLPLVGSAFGDQGYGRGGTPVFTDVFEPLARVTLYLTDGNGLGTCFGAVYNAFALRIDFVNIKHEENVRSQKNEGVTRASDP